MANTKYDENILIAKAAEIAAKFEEMLKSDPAVESRLTKAFLPYKDSMVNMWHSGYSKKQIAEAISGISGITLTESQVRTLFKKFGIAQHKPVKKSKKKADTVISVKPAITKPAVEDDSNNNPTITHSQGPAKLD